MFVLLLILANASSPAVMARANGETVTEQQVRARMERAQTMGLRVSVKGIVEDLVSEAIVLQDAYKKGVQNDPAVVATVEAERRRLAAECFVAKEIDSAAKATDAQLLEMYHGTADTAKIEIITLVDEEVAKAAFDRLSKGASLADEAKFSVDPEQARTGGQVGTRTRADLKPELAQVVFSAPLKTFVGPVNLPLGSAVVRVLEREIGSENGFPAKRESLRVFMEQQLRHQYKTHFLSQLRKTAGAKVDEEFLKKTGVGLKLDKSADHVLATVYGQPVRYGSVVAEVRRLSRGKEGGHASGPSVKTSYAWAAVDRLLLEHEAAQRGFTRDPSLAEPLRQVEGDAMLAVTGQQLRERAGKPSLAEIEAYFKGHPGEFQVPPTRACSHIVVPSRPQAVKIQDSLRRGETFEDLARDYSRDEATGRNGGQIGNLGEAELLRMTHSGEKDFAAAIRASKPGQVSDPVQTKMGWHLIRCSAPTPAKTVSFEEVRIPLAARLHAQRGEEAVQRQVNELRSHARIEIDEAAVARIAPPHP